MFQRHEIASRFRAVPLLGAALLLILCCQTSMAQNLFPNPECEITFEKNGKTRLQSIVPNSYGKSQGNGGVDTQVFHGGKASAFLDKTNDADWTGLQFASVSFKPESETREVELSLWLKAEECRAGSIILTGAAGSRHQALWKSISTFKGSFDWKEFKGKVLVPPGIQSFLLSVRLERGSGKIWVDDLALTWKKTNSPLLYNADFESGKDKLTGIPDGWFKREFEGWETNADISVVQPGYKSRNAVCLTWKSGGTKAGLQTPMLHPGQERQFTLTSMSKSTAGCPGGYLVEYFDETGKLMGSADSPAYESPQWKTQKFLFRTPENCANFRIVLLLQGNGSVWYDNVRIQSAAKEVAESFPVKAKCPSIDASLLWNQGVPVFNTFVDSPVPLSISFKGDKKQLKNPALIVEIPEELTIAQCFEVHTDTWNVVVPEKSPLDRNGRKFIRYRYSKTRLWEMLQPGYAWARTLAMAIFPANPSEAAGKDFPVCWYLENGGQFTPPNNFTLHMLPPLQDMPLPKDFRGGYWSSVSQDFPDQEIFLKVATKYEKSNMTGRQRRRGRETQDNLLKSRGWQLTTSAWTADYGKETITGYFQVPGYEKVLGKMRFRMMADGKNTATKKLCPEYFLNDVDYQNFATLATKARLDVCGYQPGEVVFLDSEPWGPLNWCFDEPCRAAFAKYANLPQTPTVDEIKKKHADTWIRFRVEQSTRVIQSLTEMVKKAYPNAIVIDYDYPLPYGTSHMMSHFRGCSKDAQRNEAFLDGHLTSYYHTLNTRCVDMIRFGVQNLKKHYGVMFAIDDAGSYLNSKEILSPRQYRLHMVAAAALGASEAWVYSNAGSETDGLFFVEIQKGMVEIARFESIFRTSEVADILSVTANGNADLQKLPIRHCVHSLGGNEFLLTVFNFDQSHPFNLEISPAKRAILDAANALDGSKLQGLNSGKLTTSLEPLGYAFLKLKLSK